MKHAPTPNLEAQLFGLSTLIQLVKRARHASSEQELAFIMVNETHALTPYRQAVLWRSDRRGVGRVTAISGAAVVERNAPLILWFNRVLSRLDKEAMDTPQPVSASNLPAKLAEEWGEWLPAHALCVPLALNRDGKFGVLLLAREQPWGDGERYLLQELADGFAQAWQSFLGGRRRSLLMRFLGWRNAYKLAILAAVCAGLCLPVRLSALAPAEVVPFKPTIVRAPLDGVVDRFLVEPNASVKAGQPLLDLDPRAIQNKLDVAGKELAVAEAEYRQAAQEAVFDDKSRAKLTVLKGRTDQRRADVAYAQSLLERIHVTASRAGLALFDDPNDWIGRPVTIGERLLEIADPTQAELEIWLPAADAITLQAGADVELFLNVAPGAPLKAKLRQASYEATPSPANLLGYRLKATLDDPAAAPRIGLRGTAKIYGDEVSLFYYLARRPLAAARQFFGW
ncbi:efflux RND transporter periplasmic adaptor subunit [Methylocapsa sp. S129]|uniref:efflux RND transporter periplasmic adaptor subunit n=1 Tax=Methylocapsa sp. S129 TaxID=1641869 RepID=UPI00131E873D|nr:HlyD family efflux transporter periplasmic adaptor subunit [Methylocapsa sp. S129]